MERPPSVRASSMSYAKGGTYSVTLTLTDRGGNVASVTQTIDVIGPPVNAGLPVISDLTSLSPANVVSGDRLEVSAGSWSGYPAPVYAYQWQDCNAAGESCTAINGATAATYTPVAADVGHTLRVEVTASNSVGSGKATSAQTAVVNAGSGQLSTSSLAPGGSSASTGTAGSSAGLHVKLQLVPESLKTLLRSGVSLRLPPTRSPTDHFDLDHAQRGQARPHRLWPAQSVVVDRPRDREGPRQRHDQLAPAPVQAGRREDQAAAPRDADDQADAARPQRRQADRHRHRPLLSADSRNLLLARTQAAWFAHVVRRAHQDVRQSIEGRLDHTARSCYADIVDDV